MARQMNAAQQTYSTATVAKTPISIFRARGPGISLNMLFLTKTFRGRGITLLCQPPAVLPIHFGIGRRPGGKAIHVAIVHTECGGDQNGVVNLLIRRAMLTGTRNVLASDILAALLDLSRDR